MITGPLFVHQYCRDSLELQYQLTLSDRIYSRQSRVHWRGVTKPTQKQIRKMRKISFFIRQFKYSQGVWLFDDADINEMLEDIRLHKMGEKSWA